MTRSALLTLYRSLTRHRLFAALNIGGLALGIAVFLVLLLFVRFETGFDRVLPGWDRLWVVQRTMQFSGAPALQIPSRPEMLALLRADYPGTVGTRLLSGDVAVQAGRTSAVERLAQVDADYFALFPLPVLAGDPAATLRTPDGAIVTERIARTYLGTRSPLGRTLAVTLNGKPRLFRVGALIRDLPLALTHRNDIFIGLRPDAQMFGQGSAGLVTFLRFDDPATAAARTAQLPAFDARHPDPNFTGAPDKLRTTETLAPLASLHLAEPRDRAVVAALGTVGLLALLVAVANYVNLATARAGLRAREVALRKVLGGTRRMLIGQFLAEAVAATAAATLIALALVELALPLVNAVGGTTLAIRYLGAGSILPSAAALVVAVGLLAGFHPAFVLSRYQPASVLAAARAPGGGRGGRRLRLVMVVIQFAIAIALMIGTAVLLAQTRHLQSADLGFRRAGLVMVPSFADVSLDAAQRHDLSAAIAAVPEVIAITQSSVAAGATSSFGIATMHREGASGPDPSIVQDDVGANFFQTYGARLLAGRWFDLAHAGDEAPTHSRPAVGRRSHAIILNRAAAARLGFASPAAAVGRTVTVGSDDATIIGVVDDLRFDSPRVPVQAQAYSLRTQDLFSPVLALRYGGDDPRAVLARLEAAWRRIAPAVPYNAITVDQELYESYYKSDAQRSRLFTIGAVLAVVIGCIGLYGLAAFDTARRVKEIGIRKTLGASTGDVLRLLIGQFMRPVLIANVIAWPIAFVAMRRWLSGFDDRVALSPLFFVGASLAAVLIAAATIAGQAWRVARAEPARALRHD